MKTLITVCLTALAALTPVAHAQHSGHTATAASAKTELADGEVRRVDKAKGTVLLKHGEIKSLGMGAMTMGFKFKDPKLAEGLAVGDKVKFAAEQKGDDLIITTIVKTP